MLPSAAFAIPLTVIILVNFLRNIPDELYESMRADGAGRWRMLVNLALSLSRPALITVTIYDALNVWNGFLFPLILTQSPDNRVLPLFVWGFQGEFTINIPAILASVVLSTLPILALYVLGRRRHRRTHGGLRQMRNRSGREQRGPRNDHLQRGVVDGYERSSGGECVRRS